MLNFPNDPPEIPSASKLSASQIQVVASRHARRVDAGFGDETDGCCGWIFGGLL